MFELKNWSILLAMAQTSARGGTLTAKANGGKLAALRGGLQLKQRDVEEQLDIPRGQLTRFETGKPVGIKYILKLATFYRVHPRELLDPAGVISTSDLLTDLAKLHGARVDFGSNGDSSNHPTQIGVEKEPETGINIP